MENQAEQFESARSQLLTTYLNHYVWFEKGTVVDHDADFAPLFDRAILKASSQPLFIRQVLRTEPKPIVRTPILTYQ